MLSKVLKRSLVQAAALIVITMAVVAYALWDKVATEQLTSRRLESFEGIRADRVKFASSGLLIATELREGSLLISSIELPDVRRKSKTIPIGISNPDLVSVDPSGSRAIWYNNGQIFSEALRGFAPSASVDSPEAPVLLRANNDGLAAAISSNGSLRILEATSLRPLTSTSLPFANADMAEVFGPYLAVADRASGQIVVLELSSSKIRTLEFRNVGARLAAVAVTTGGRLAIATERGSLELDSRVAAPGLVRALDFFEPNRVLAVGNFEDAYILSAARPPERLIRVAVGSKSVAANGGYVAVAGPSGLEVHNYSYALGVSATGKKLLQVWAVIGGLLAIAMLAKFTYRLWLKIRQFILLFGAPRAATGKEPVAEKALVDLLDPSSDLLNQVLNSECILVVGEELSKPCGFPVWKSFVYGLIDWLSDNRLIEPAIADRVRATLNSGGADTVFESIADRFAQQHQLILEHARAMYTKPAPLSNVHESLNKVRFGGAMTFNLDPLLEKALLIRDSEIFTVDSLREAAGLVEQKKLFLVKLRGAWREPESVVLSPKAAASALARSAEYSEFIAHLLNSRTLLFIGVSPDEIELMLAPAKLVQAPARKHHAFVPKGPGLSGKGLDKMHKRYGVRFVSYPTDDSQAICDFLGKLAEAQLAAAAAQVGRH